MFLYELAPESVVERDHRHLMVFGVTDDSRDVRYGSVFFAIPGTHDDGLRHIRSAAERGAQAVFVPEHVTDEEIGLSPYELSKIIIVRHPNVRRAFAQSVSRFFPVRPSTIVGVTGTNGKTSSVSILVDLWRENNLAAKSLGTLGIREGVISNTNLEASLTTFDAKTIHIMMSELKSTHNISHVAMEVSSHALEQNRVDGIDYDAAVFTNLTQDHLDYHYTMENYFAAKERLFKSRLKDSGVAVVNIDDHYSNRILDVVRARECRLVTTSAQGKQADLKIIKRTPLQDGQEFQLSVFGKVIDAFVPVIGAFQGDNILAALGAAIGTGISVDGAAGALGKISPIPGRCEFVSKSHGASIFVDYAHTPDALEKILVSLRPHVGNKLHVVFGCGGDRDPTKRAKMGKVATDNADVVWVTDDNPRSENPATIRAQILSGAPHAIDAGDRKNAIAVAIDDLTEGDILVIAGKGHEDYQIVKVDEVSGTSKLEKVKFSDQDIVREFVGSRL